MSTKLESRTILSLRFKLLIPLLVLLTVIFALSYFGIQRYIKDTIFGNLEEETTAINDYVEGCMDGDQLQALIESDVQYDESVGWSSGMTDPQYWDLQDCLAKVYEFNPRAELFTYHAVDQDTFAYGLDEFAAIEPDNSLPFREIVPKGEEDYSKYQLGLEDVYHYDELKYDEQGDIYYYATIAPIKNSAGEVVSGLVIYLNASWVTEGLQDLSITLLGVFVGIYILIALLVWLITRNATSQLEELKAAASRVADGNYTHITLKSHSIGDEVSTLTELFNIMLDKVRGREENLKQEVVQLKIEIDQVKREKQVKEIVDSDFFSDLKSKSETMRKRRSPEKKE
jgi:methyl-accepting chemotaxis protein